MNRWFSLSLLLIVFGAMAFRLPQLSLRPMHNDENVNAIKCRDLWLENRYQYDPHEYHGPSLYYATLPFIWLSSAETYEQLSEVTLRLVPVCFGVLLIVMLWGLRDALGKTGTLAAAALTALSPAMVFYSRYYIHEMLLVAFTLLTLLSCWRYLQTRSPIWAALSGVGLGLMYATKETFVLSVVAMLLGWAATVAYNRWREGRPFEFKRYWNAGHFWIAAAAAGVVSMLLFTSFFTNLRGPLDSILSYLPWTQRAGGNSPHIYPWYFYFQRLFYFHAPRGPRWSEGLILVLAYAGVMAGLTGKGLAGASVFFVRFLSFYTIFLSGIYSAISYKTPWCFLSFFHGMILLAGVGAAVLLRLAKPKWAQVAVGTALLVATGHLGWQAWRASYGIDRLERLYAATPVNPYVYAQTVPDIFELVNKVRGIAEVHPEGKRMLIKVMSRGGDYFPLPWYLREFEQTGWWDEAPEDPYAPVMIVGTKLELELEQDTNPRHLMVGLYSLRLTTFYALYVEEGLWARYLKKVETDRAKATP